MDRREKITTSGEVLPVTDTHSRHEYLKLNLARLRMDQMRAETKLKRKIDNGETITGESGMEVGPSEVREDLREAKEYRERIGEPSDIALLGEIVVYRLIEAHGLLGPGAKVIKTLDVDDFGDEKQRHRGEGGTDLIVEIEYEGEVLRIAIDVTTADPRKSLDTLKVLDTKTSKIRHYAGAGKDSARVKYCSSKLKPDFVGPVYASKVLVVLPEKLVRELADLDARAQLGEDEEAELELSSHPAAAAIALQIDLALKLAQERAQRISRAPSMQPADRDLANIIVRRTSVFRERIKEKTAGTHEKKGEIDTETMQGMHNALSALYGGTLPPELQRAIRTRN